MKEKNNILRLILWYTFIVLTGALILELYELIKALVEINVDALILVTIFILIHLIFLIPTIKLLRKNSSSIMFYTFFTFWILQLVFFGIKGNDYTFVKGPMISVYTRLVENFEFGHIFRIWSHEISVSFNQNDDRIFFGINIIPLIITILLFWVKNKNAKNYNLENAEMKENLENE